MGKSGDDRPWEDTLTECLQRIEELQEENAQLRYAAETFGDLAERLNAERRAADASARGHEFPTVRRLNASARPS